MSDRKELRESLTGDILKGALTAGATAGVTQFGSNIKGGLTGMGKEIVKPEVIGASAEEIAKTKSNIKSLSETRGKNLIEGLQEETYARKSPTFETPDVPDVTGSGSGITTGSGSGSVLGSDDYKEKFFKRFGRYPEQEIE